MLRFSDLFILLKGGKALNPRSKNQSKRSAKPLTPGPSPLKRGEGSKHKDVGKDEVLHGGVNDLYNLPIAG